MANYIVNFTHNGQYKKEDVVAVNIFQADKIIKDKYGKENVDISSISSKPSKQPTRPKQKRYTQRFPW